MTDDIIIPLPEDYLRECRELEAADGYIQFAKGKQVVDMLDELPRVTERSLCKSIAADTGGSWETWRDCARVFRSLPAQVVTETGEVVRLKVPDGEGGLRVAPEAAPYDAILWSQWRAMLRSEWPSFERALDFVVREYPDAHGGRLPTVAAINAAAKQVVGGKPEWWGKWEGFTRSCENITTDARLPAPLRRMVGKFVQVLEKRLEEWV